MRDFRPRAGAGAGAHAQYPRVGRQVDEQRIEQQIQRLTNRRHPRPLLVVARRLLVEQRLDFLVTHGHASFEGSPSRLPASQIGKDTRMPDYLILISTLGGLALLGLNGFVIGPLVAALFVANWNLFEAKKKVRLPD